MRKKEAIILKEKVTQTNKSLSILNQNLEKIDNLNLANAFREVLAALNNINNLLAKNNELKQQTNDEINGLIDEVKYANRRLAN